MPSLGRRCRRGGCCGSSARATSNDRVDVLLASAPDVAAPMPRIERMSIPSQLGFARAVSVVALVAMGILVAGCHDSGSSSRPHSASSDSTATGAVTDSLAELRSRPVRVPSKLPRGVNCTQPTAPVARQIPGVHAEAALGTGPAYVESRGIPRIWYFNQGKLGWRRAVVLWIVDPSYRGPILVRGAAVHSHLPLGFGSTRKPTNALTLPETTWRHRLPNGIWGLPVRLQRGWRAASAVVRVRHRGCYFFQVDGTSFSETITFFAVSG
jgi:hypothetical protein